MNAIGLDYETYYSTKEGYGISELGGWGYVNDPRFDPYMLSVSDGENHWAGHPRDFNWNALEGQLLLSHNRAFDHLVYNRQVELGWVPKVNFAGWECTANLTAFLCNRRSLAQSYEHLYGAEVSKAARSKADGRKWDSYSAEDRKEMLQYALGDAIKCQKIWADHSHKWPQWERDLSNQTIEIGWRGVNVDWEKVDQYTAMVHGMLQETDQRLPWVKEGGKPTSPKQIAEHCRRCNIPAPPVKTHDAEGFIAWEAEHGPSHPWISCISSHRSLNTLLSLLQTIRSRRRPDGTMPFALKYFGGHTGRWSGDAGVNMQNQRKGYIFRNQTGLMETDENKMRAAEREHSETGKWPAWVTGVIDMRSIYIPRAGKKFIIADLSQIEPRVLNWLAGNHSLLKMISGGMAIYEAFAREFMGWRGGALKTENPGLYALAKANVLGLGYGCGWNKFITVAQSMAGIDITKDDPEWIEQADPITGDVTKVSGYGHFSKQCVNQLRDANPKITDLWQTLDEGFKRSVGGDFSMTLPSGRQMTYRQVRCEIRTKADAEGNIKKERVYTAEVDGRRYGFYGGALTENLVQATSRDVFGQQLLQLPKDGYGDVVFHVHDEVILECDPGVDKKDVEHAMSQTPEWMPGLPLAAEAVDATFYKK